MSDYVPTITSLEVSWSYTNKGIQDHLRILEISRNKADETIKELLRQYREQEAELAKLRNVVKAARVAVGDDPALVGYSKLLQALAELDKEA